MTQEGSSHTTATSVAHTHVHTHSCTSVHPDPHAHSQIPQGTVSKCVELEAGMANCPYSPETTLVSASRVLLKPITSQSQVNQTSGHPAKGRRLTDNKDTKGPLENRKDLQGDLEVLLEETIMPRSQSPPGALLSCPAPIAQGPVVFPPLCFIFQSLPSLRPLHPGQDQRHAASACPVPSSHLPTCTFTHLGKTWAEIVMTLPHLCRKV